jgi:TBC1 domain family member 15
MRLQLQTLDHLVQLLDPKLYLHLQKADSTNFFFFFRMLLVWYKREFAWLDILRLWEVLWTDYLSSNFHLFVALAILEKHRDVIMKHLQHFDEVLKYVNELSNTIDLESTLVGAERLFRRFQRTVEAVDRKDSFPAPSSVRQRRIGPGLPSASRDGKTSRATPALLNKPAAASAEGSSVQPPGDADASSSVDTSAASKGKRKSVGESAEPGSADSPLMGNVISPELRGLLSREVVKLDKKEVRERGGGVGK